MLIEYYCWGHWKKHSRSELTNLLNILLSLQITCSKKLITFLFFTSFYTIENVFYLKRYRAKNWATTKEENCTWKL